MNVEMHSISKDLFGTKSIFTVMSCQIQVYSLAQLCLQLVRPADALLRLAALTPLPRATEWLQGISWGYLVCEP